MNMNKKLIVAAMVVPILLASGIAASAYVYSGCKYNSITGNYIIVSVVSVCLPTPLSPNFN